MEKLKTIIISVTAILVMLTVLAFTIIKPAKTGQVVKDNGFAVIELFTSEGCSSCPPADALVAQIAKEYKTHPVYILAYHVDYWNRLGWRDVFSDAAYSARQYQYAKYLKTPQVYTPQIVVNGKNEFVGSDEKSLHNNLQIELQQAPPAKISLTNVKVDGDKAILNYQAEGNGNNTILLLALVQKSAKSSIKAGENKGRNLVHVQIVRRLQTVVLSDRGRGVENVTLPKEFSAQNWELIGLLQNTNTGEIIGATKLVLASEV